MASQPPSTQTVIDGVMASAPQALSGCSLSPHLPNRQPPDVPREPGRPIPCGPVSAQSTWHCLPSPSAQLGEGHQGSPTPDGMPDRDFTEHRVEEAPVTF